MEKVKTATGKEFDCDYYSVIPSPAQAYIRILNTSLATVASVFGNKQETMQLWLSEHYISQYTKLVAIIPELDAIKIILEKE